MIFLHGKQLMRMYKPCYLDAAGLASSRGASRRRRERDVALRMT